MWCYLRVEENLKYALRTKDKRIINQVFEEIYYEYGHLIGFVISQYVKNKSDAEELINDVKENHQNIEILCGILSTLLYIEHFYSNFTCNLPEIIL